MTPTNPFAGLETQVRVPLLRCACGALVRWQWLDASAPPPPCRETLACGVCTCTDGTPVMEGEGN